MVGDLAAQAASAVVASAVQATPFVTSIACAKRSVKNKFVLENLGGFPTCNSGRFIRRPYQPPSLYPSFVPNVLCKTKFDSETLRRRLPARWSPPPYRRAPRPVSSHKTTHTHTQTYTHTHTHAHTHIHAYTHTHITPPGRLPARLSPLCRRAPARFKATRRIPVEKEPRYHSWSGWFVAWGWRGTISE